MKKELQSFFAALSFYTRIVPPRSFQNSHQNSLRESVKFFPLIGWIAGLFAALIYLFANYFFGLLIGIAFSMISSILLTGALHEDGFADFCDGFGGGWTKEKILAIMKDSRLGTFGVIGLVGVLSLKFMALQKCISTGQSSGNFCFIFLQFITAHSLSRFTAATFVFSHSYIQTEASKFQLSGDQINKKDVFITALFGFIPLLVLIFATAKPGLLFILLPLFVLKKYLGRYFTKWIGGYTGDCLGATQQLAEIIIYLSFTIIWKFTL